ncbi:type VII secretion system-associated protein [Actinophytocola sp.]|uniref:type VII secretion system-associated protein n=1 Tax=Actinophytocola sp. TaxID=1872138 RepID=UPI00389AB203
MTVEADESTGGGVFFLIDPAWQPTEEGEATPVTSVIGAWPVTEAGRGRFQPNPLYLPSTKDSPLDPVDAVLRLLARGEFDPDQLPEVLSDVMLGIALDEQGVAIVRHAPDGVPAVLVTTSYGHRLRIDAAGWRNVTLTQLAEALPARGVDVLLNPGAPTSMRVLADAVRAVAAGQSA